MYQKSSKPIVCINGSRSITDINLDLFINPDHCGIIVTGCAKGVDTLAEWWAKRNNIEWIGYPANWKLYGKRAGLMRNEEMINFCDVLISFYDGKSSGTLYTINYAKKLDIPVYVYLIESLD